MSIFLGGYTPPPPAVLTAEVFSWNLQYYQIQLGVSLCAKGF